MVQLKIELTLDQFKNSDLNVSEYSQPFKKPVEKKTVVLHIVSIMENFLIQFGLDWNMMLNCKHKNLQKFLFFLEMNCMLCWMICKKWYHQSNRINRLLSQNQLMELPFRIHGSLENRMAFLTLFEMLNILTEIVINHLDLDH